MAEAASEHDPDALLHAVRALHARLRVEARERWQRDLPFDELAFDRWERARELGFGEGTSVYQSSYVYGDVKVGRDTWIGPFTLLDGSGSLEIGDNCSISTGVQIYSHDTVAWALSGGSAPYEHAPVRIGSCCYVGPNSVIAKGVSIGDHCVVGTASFVNCDLPAYAIAVGSPCKIIGRVRLEAGVVELDYRGPPPGSPIDTAS